MTETDFELLQCASTLCCNFTYNDEFNYIALTTSPWVALFPPHFMMRSEGGNLCVRDTPCGEATIPYSASHVKTLCSVHGNPSDKWTLYKPVLFCSGPLLLVCAKFPHFLQSWKLNRKENIMRHNLPQMLFLKANKIELKKELNVVQALQSLLFRFPVSIIIEPYWNPSEIIENAGLFSTNSCWFCHFHPNTLVISNWISSLQKNWHFYDNEVEYRKSFDIKGALQIYYENLV